ncbi:MAG TPA: hypothetical protein IAB62_11635 [Candidatus Coprocola pullicola]|nr:hypothetical protein [Candidatus Coprocola pullicola]
MKVILSRKGMDSKSGGIANPILPDGTLLSLPIPDKTAGTAYKDLYYKEQSFKEIICQLYPKFDFNENQTCHLDPDIYEDIEGRTATDKWKPAFGQHGVSAVHLDKLSVGVGDIFLFYGMFQKTVYQPDKTLCFVRNSPIVHIIYGYMKVGKILRVQQEIERYSWHPHSINPDRPNNRLYLPDTYGTFQYDDSLVLTKEGQDNRRLWTLPAFFGKDGISISWQGDNRPVLKDGYAELNSACRGQEFVVTASTPKQERNLCEWVVRLIQKR